MINKENFQEIICVLYEQLYRQAILRHNFIYRPSNADIVLISRFNNWINKTYSEAQIGENLLINYFEFQFAHYAGVITPQGRNSIMINWIIGKKARDRWLARDSKKKYIVKYRIKKEVQLLLKTVLIKFKVTNKSNKPLELKPYEEAAKQKYYNTLSGFVYCTQMTTLFTPISELCQKCNNKEKCINRLKIVYPKLYVRREESITERFST